jgi:hypothetical protein
MALVYGIDPKNKRDYAKWLATHQPFHWFAEFYQIIAMNGGFDVVIGNPPYVVYSKKNSKTKQSIKDIYKIKNYKTESTDNLYAFTIERGLQITNSNSRNGMIIPISGISNDNFTSLQNIFVNDLITWQSSFSNRPAKLFPDVEQRLVIFVSEKVKNDRK